MNTLSRHLLVTGGAGFVGTNFVHHWLAKYPNDRVVVLDALTYAGDAENLAAARSNPNFRFIHGNICDEPLVNSVIAEEAIDIVVHFAAESHVDRSIAGPDPFIETNVVGTHVLLKAAKAAWLDGKRAGPCRFHHVSTDEVYGTLNIDDPPFTEQTPYAPNSPYSASKAASDHLVRAYHQTYGLPITISNCSNNYGPYQHREKLIPLMLSHGMQGLPLPVYGKGANIRDWLYVEDHCKAIDVILHKGREGETYNIGGNCEMQNLELVKQLCRLLDEMRPDSPHAPHQKLIRFVADRLGHDLRYAIDGSKMRDELDWKPAETFDSGLLRTARWYLEAIASKPVRI
ncbi:dTDP-glucose 4,6-dehydratase [Dyella sp.]|uniref:dTDP-glucose 4,6-dehydratase n=1 Tax=Dyella sp. TaxID=1869338 RepID=UPI002D776672|nr:dTDP-glucose 4,6-dehydratase [Dyella sp.]HET7330190.1 dTDP-glucose 4,6-dehydratase [Dyella sp.]